jgi:glycosyltransferase involved in cell wall biosynthesis
MLGYLKNSIRFFTANCREKKAETLRLIMEPIFISEEKRRAIMMTLKDFVYRNRALLTVARSLFRLVRRYQKPERPWKFEPNLKNWIGYINTPEAEKISGIHQKIMQVQRLGPVTIIGGLTTGGADDIFFEVWPNALRALHARMDDVPDGGNLLLYIPHHFWARVLDERYHWLPTWTELFDLFDGDRHWTVFQYSPSFDAAGRYFFIAQKRPTKTSLPPQSLLTKQTFRVFYHPGGADLAQGHSSYALSAHLCNALSSMGVVVYSYSFMNADAVFKAEQHDILIGHVGPWVRKAYDLGCRRIILYNPVNRWYATRHLGDIEANATIAEQVAMSRMVIAQSGAIWRLTADYPQPEKWRWIDIGIDPMLFPRVKHRFNPAGHRRFCFIHLYDADQKGVDIAQEIIRARQTYSFSWIGGKPFTARNVRLFGPIHNTDKRFQKIVADCDFILVPSREDAQPGVPIEAMSLGVISVTTYTCGYSYSYPRLIEPNTLDEWLKVVDFLQQVSDDELLRCQAINDYYLHQIHNWAEVERQTVFYLREFLRTE